MRELLLSIVSSRIRWELAWAIVEDLLAATQAQNCRKQAGFDRAALSDSVQSAVARHRHPRRVASWIETLLDDDGGILRETIDIMLAPQAAAITRRLLVTKVPGLGPKQASLLLRNVGRGQHLAVLDRHVLRFIKLLGLTSNLEPVATIASYELVERVFVDYAAYRRVPADALDLAVWIVMRTAREGYVRGYRNISLQRARLDVGSLARGRAGTDPASFVY